MEQGKGAKNHERKHPSRLPPSSIHGFNNWFQILSGSTKTSQETVEWEDGNTYPVIRVEVTSDSHPFYTGRQNSHKQTDVWTVSTKIRSQRRKRCGIIKTLITQRLADYLIG